MPNSKSANEKSDGGTSVGRKPGQINNPTRSSPVKHQTSSSWSSFGLYVCSFTILACISTYLRYALPDPLPLPDPISTVQPTSPLYFSEALANTYIHHLGDTIGYRIVGTEEMSETVEYVLDLLEGLKADAKKVGNTKEIEIWHQQDDGAHLFEFMGKHVWKKYFQLSNIIVRISDPSIPRSKENAILVNAHLDSTLPSPGAADDVAGVAVLLEAIRIITQSPEWKIYNSIVFLFNGAEESLQDASHLFITKHPLKDVVRAVINLEACGTNGQEILFQATSHEMIRAYSQVPRPFGTIIATEVFHTGLIASDTDFRQFEHYGNLTGLDMAIMQNSYLYHTRQDIPSKIEKGVIQHMGENTMALLKHLSAETTDLTNIERSSSTVYFSAFGGYAFFMYSKTTALQLYLTMFVVAMTLVSRNVNSSNRKVYLLSVFASLGSFLASIIFPNLAAFITATVLQKPLSWYRHEALPLALFAPPSLVGALSVQYLFSKLVKARSLLPPGHEFVLAHAIFCGLMVFYGILAVIGAFFRIGTAYLPALGLGSLLLGLIFNELVFAPLTGRHGHLHLPSYLVALVLPCLLGVEGILVFLDLFVPLSGRIGHEPHVDHIIASLVSGVGFNIVASALPFSHRFSTRTLRSFILLATVVSAILVLVFTRDGWVLFDADHPKRLPVLHMENITTTPPTFSLHLASMDRAPGFYELVKDTMDVMAVSQQTPILNAINDDIPDWDIIYPVSQFLKSYQIPLISDDHRMITTDGGQLSQYVSPWTDTFKINLLHNKLDHINHHRTLVFAVDHPGIIWTVIAFTADVVSWDLPENPTRGIERHHIKEASAFGVDRWTLNVTIALNQSEFDIAIENEQIIRGQRPSTPASDEKALANQRRGMLRIDFSGLDQMGLYPARALPKRVRKGQEKPDAWIGTGVGGPGMKFFRRLDTKLPSWTDPMLLSAVANVAYL